MKSDSGFIAVLMDSKHGNILPGWVEVAMFSVLNEDMFYGWQLFQEPLYHLLFSTPMCCNILEKLIFVISQRSISIFLNKQVSFTIPTIYHIY